MPAKIHWEPEEEHLLAELYATTPICVISKRLGKSKKNVIDRARLLRLKSLPRKDKKHPLHFYDGSPKFTIHPNGCWLWTAATNAKGYPTEKGKHTTLAYREIYIRKFGPIPPGMTLDHICKHRSCVNIEHLELVQHIINVRRSKRTILSKETVLLIRCASDSTRQLADMLGVTYNAVYFARRGDSWKNL